MNNVLYGPYIDFYTGNTGRKGEQRKRLAGLPKRNCHPLSPANTLSPTKRILVFHAIIPYYDAFRTHPHSSMAG